MTGLFDAEERLRPLFEVHGRPKKNNVKDIRLKPGSARKRAERVVAQAPEVVVKVTGHARGPKHVRRLLQYITRDGELVGENEAGESITGKAAVAEFAKDWNDTIGRRRANTRDTVNIVLSMPASTDPAAVFNAARALAREEFQANFEYVMVLHTPETDPSEQPSPNPHVHLIVKSLGHDGRRLNPRKADLQRWRDLFAERLRDQGIEAESTPRFARGVVRKATRQPLHHAQQRQPRTQRLESTVQEVAAEAVGRVLPPERPWEAAIRQKQALTRGAWLDAAKSLETSSEAGDRQLAQQIRAFVAAMPAVKTQREEISEQLRVLLSERAQQRSASDPGEEGQGRGPER